MAERKPASKSAKKSATSAPKGFTDEEKSAMRERVKELKAAAGKADGERDVLAKIAAMAPADRALGERVHKIIKANAPSLSPKLWYGMPAYAKGERIVFHFQDAQKFKMRYATLGFTDAASVDDGAMWPVAYALKKLTAADEARIAALVKKAVS
jgi:uncharacterized protein YdhG (YjbR/CyaY superfamily)